MDLNGGPAEVDIPELSPAVESVARAIGEGLAGDGGAALILDYGYARHGSRRHAEAVRGHCLLDQGQAETDGERGEPPPARNRGSIRGYEQKKKVSTTSAISAEAIGCPTGEWGRSHCSI